MINRYNGICAACNGTVVAGEGTATKVNNKWQIKHAEGNCLAVPAEPVPAPTRSNRYAAPCADCGGRVPAQSGVLTREDGAWITRHTQCPEALPDEPEELTYAEAGKFYAYKGEVYTARARKDALPDDPYTYLMRLTKGGWKFEKGGLRSTELAAADITPLTALEAARAGIGAGICLYCGATLTDGLSAACGFGETCGRKYGLTALRKATKEALASLGTVSDSVGTLALEMAANRLQDLPNALITASDIYCEPAPRLTKADVPTTARVYAEEDDL